MMIPDTKYIDAESKAKCTKAQIEALDRLLLRWKDCEVIPFTLNNLMGCLFGGFKYSSGGEIWIGIEEDGYTHS